MEAYQMSYLPHYVGFHNVLKNNWKTVLGVGEENSSANITECVYYALQVQG